jgi:superfamily II DNA helicase RecQ
MDGFNRIFEHLPQYQIIVCRRCQFAVPPFQVNTHIQAHHNWEPKSIRVDVVAYVSQLSELAWVQDEVVYPEAGSKPLSGIPVRSNAFECNRCGFVCQTKNAIQSHCRTAHGWKSGKSQGGSLRKRAEPDPYRIWTEGVSIQVWFRYAQWKQGVRVCVSPTIPIGPRLQEIGDEIINDLERRQQKEQEKRTVKVAKSRVDFNSWLAHTKWDEHLDEFGVGLLQNSVQPISSDEEEISDNEVALQRVCKQIGRVIRLAFDKCKSNDVGRSALHIINRKENGAQSNEKPFYKQHGADTLRKYCIVICKLVRYLWRSQGWPKRPAYIFTAEQELALEELRNAGLEFPEQGKRQERREGKERIRDSIVAFWMSLIQHPLDDSEWDSGLISGLAVLGLDTNTGGWATAMNYTPRLSAVVTVTRALVVYFAWHQRDQQVQEYIQQGQSEQEARNNSVKVWEIVSDIARRFMTLQDQGGHPTPLDRVMHMRTFGMKIRYNTKATARVDWSKDGQVFSIDKSRFHMDELRAVVRELVESCREKLAKLMFIAGGGDQLPQIPIDQIRDNQADGRPRWSFIKEMENSEVFAKAGLGDDSRKWLWRQLTHGENEEMRRLFIERPPNDEDTWQTMPWKATGWLEYFDRVKEFKELLIVATHLTAGAPGRGPEVMSIAYQNDPDGRVHRGIFVHDGLVELVVDYHKGASASNRPKIIHRFVPQEVGELVIMFLWAVQPFVEIFQTIQADRMGRKDFVAGGYQMWEIKPEPEYRGEGDEGDEEDSTSEEEGGEGEDEESGEEEEEEEEEGEQSRPQEISSEESEGEDRVAIQAPRGKQRQVECSNVDGFWDTDRLKRVMRRVWKSSIGTSISPAQWRQLFPAILRMHSADPVIHTLLDSVYLGKKPEAIQEQSGHTRFTEERMYGLRTDENPFSTQGEQARFKRASQHWHRLLHFESALGRRVEDEEKERVRQEREQEKWRDFRKVNLHRMLRQMKGDRAEFRGQQEEGLRAIMRGEDQVIVVMGTGSGKSLLYMLPAICSPDGLTILVVPIVALQDDQERRCREAGLAVHCWNSRSNIGTRSAQVVIVTPESAVTKAFGRLINSEYYSGRLERIVIDECHVVLDSINGWRAKIRELKEMTEKGVQMVWMTATLPPKNEEEWMRAMGVDETRAVWIREATTRKNIAYRVQEYAKADENHEVKDLVEAKLKEYGDGSIIVYCQQIKQCKTLSEELHCPTYFREVGIAEEKARLLEELRKGRIRVITATNALGMGIDIPNIRVVINVGIRTTIRQFAQESGRAGRDGMKSESIIMRSYRQDWGRKRLDRGFEDTEREMIELVGGKRCMRVIIDGDIDGRMGRFGCEVGEEMCWVCRYGGNKRVRVRVVHPAPIVEAEQGEQIERHWVENSPIRSRTLGRDASPKEADQGPGRARQEKGESKEGEEGESEEGEEGESEEGEEGDSEEGEEGESGEGDFPSQMGELPAESTPSSKRARAESGLTIERELEERRRQRIQTMNMRKRQQEEGGLVDMVGLQEKMRRWKEVDCIVCWVLYGEAGEGGGRNQGQGWENCGRHGQDEGMRKAVEGMKRVEWEKWAGCLRCRVPQGACLTWEESVRATTGRTAGFRRRPGGQCQGKGIFEEVMAAVMSQTMRRKSGEAWEWAEKEMRGRMGFWRRDEEGWEQLWRWIGRRRKEGGYDISEGARMVYLWG